MEDQFMEVEKIPNEYQLFTLNDVAKIFKTTKRTIYRLIEKGELKTVKFGGNYYVKKEVLDEIINGNAGSRIDKETVKNIGLYGYKRGFEKAVDMFTKNLSEEEKRMFSEECTKELTAGMDTEREIWDTTYKIMITNKKA